MVVKLIVRATCYSKLHNPQYAYHIENWQRHDACTVHTYCIFQLFFTSCTDDCVALKKSNGLFAQSSYYRGEPTESPWKIGEYKKKQKNYPDPGNSVNSKIWILHPKTPRYPVDRTRVFRTPLPFVHEHTKAKMQWVSRACSVRKQRRPANESYGFRSC